MILYSKSGDFLGIGKDELSFLGYEDLDEFKSIHSDVADLFVNKPGYIFKFKNFSWIDYALHSGAPKKSVIIKLKTGNEVEIEIKIKELFLYTPKENEDLYYSIEFGNNISKNSSLQNDSTFIRSAPIPQASSSSTITQDTVSAEEDFVQNEPENLTIDFNKIQQKDENLTPKLKINDTIFENSDEAEALADISDDFIDDYKNEEQPKLKIDTTFEDEPFKPTIDITSNYEEKTTKKIVEETPSFETSKDIDSRNNTVEEEILDFDLVQCVEELGLDISLVGELITDYMDEIDNSIPDIKTSIENSSESLLKRNIYKLKGISDNLYMEQLSNRLEKILETQDKETRNEELEKFKKLVKKFRGELIWEKK